ncbi:MAG: sulfotransferase [Gammaproteobacteria bacterium]|nr:sulfotransferase [Gammaproteobacteria bacterium]
MKKFIVAGTQRSGTTLVTTSLDSHPSIHCAGELFKMRRPRGEVNVMDSGYLSYLDSAMRARLTHRLSKRFSVRAFLDEFFDRPGFEAIGFKLMINQTNPGRFPMVIDYLIERQISVIHVFRENVVKVYLSRLVARHTSVFHIIAEPQKLSRLRIETGDLVSQLSKIETQFRQINETFQDKVPYLEVTYEEHVANPEKQAQRLLSFLELPSVPLSSPLVKIAPDDLSLTINNMAEVEQCLHGTRYLKWLA